MQSFSALFMQSFLFDTKRNKIKSVKEKAKGVKHMKGYVTDKGYMGLVEGCYILFASEREYYDYMED